MQQSNNIILLLSLIRTHTPTHPPTHPHTQIEEAVCDQFKQSLPEQYLHLLKEEETLSLLCLGAFALMLGKCCRGWGLEQGGGASETPLTDDSKADFTTVISETVKQRQQHFPRDPLQRYKMAGSSRAHQPVVVHTQSSPGEIRHDKRGSITGRLDLGSFLIGVDVSLRHSESQQTQGLFGPLSNGGCG